MGNIFCVLASIQWRQFNWILPWNLMGWSSNYYNEDWNEGAGPPPAANEYDRKYNRKKGKIATFAMGHFTRAESRLGIVPGVIRTRIGYAGGYSKHPTFYNRGTHLAVVDVEFDSSLISYKELLVHFWNGHDYTLHTKKHPSVIFYHNKQQEVVATISRQERQQYEEINLMAENPWPRIVRTKIWKCHKLWPAEHFAQKHTLQWHLHLLDWIGLTTEREVVWSSLAMRINSILNGEVDRKEIHDFLERLKLPNEVHNYILYQSHYQERYGVKTRTTGKQRFEEILT